MTLRKKSGKAKTAETPVPGKASVKVKWAKTTDFQVPVPRNEKERVVTLREYRVLDTPAEQEFDNLTCLAALICHTPMAMISLVDSERQWFKSKVGISLAETPRNISMCAHAIMNPNVFIVRDACKDPRFAASPLVTSDPKIRFYAGAPIIGPENHILGTLCVMDHVPRVLSKTQNLALQALSRQVMLQLEMRRQLLELRKAARCC